MSFLQICNWCNITFTCETWDPGALYLLALLKASLNSSSVMLVSLNIKRFFSKQMI